MVRKLHQALGSGVGVIVELIPQLALIVGPTDAMPASAPAQAQLRLDRLFPRFVEVFACAGHPLVLFLDDLQWADAATLRMIERLMVSCDRSCMLVIGAYRDNEVGAAHPLIALRDKLLARDVRLSTLLLSALTEPQMAQMVSATVRVAAPDCAPLTSICYRKTAGNPFSSTSSSLRSMRQGICATGPPTIAGTGTCPRLNRPNTQITWSRCCWKNPPPAQRNAAPAATGRLQRQPLHARHACAGSGARSPANTARLVAGTQGGIDPAARRTL